MAASHIQTVNESGFVDDWQSGKTLAECNLRMFNTQNSCDVTFRCGQNGHEIRAHRYILVSRSCVFHAMFSGPLAETSDVNVPEIEPTFFKQLLLYLYTNEATVDSENATAVLYAARKYAVGGLESKCTEFLETNLNAENACVVLEASHQFDQKELFEKAMTLIKSNAEEAVQSPGFLALSHVLMDRIVESDDFNADEQMIFTAVSNWAEVECVRNGREVTPEAKRSVLGKTIYKIRFTRMKLTFVSNIVKSSGMLSSEERLMIMDCILHPEDTIQPFSNIPRHPYKQSQTTRPRTSKPRFNKLGYLWLVGRSVDAISFKSNKDLLIHGCQLYGLHKTKYLVTYKVTLYLSSEDDVLNTVVQNETIYEAKENVFDVVFHAPVNISAEVWYTLAVIMTGTKTCHGVNGMQRIVCDDGVVFDFKDSSASLNGTSVGEGQIPSILYSML